MVFDHFPSYIFFPIRFHLPYISWKVQATHKPNSHVKHTEPCLANVASYFPFKKGRIFQSLQISLSHTHLFVNELITPTEVDWERWATTLAEPSPFFPDFSLPGLPGSCRRKSWRTFLVLPAPGLTIFYEAVGLPGLICILDVLYDQLSVRFCSSQVIQTI